MNRFQNGLLIRKGHVTSEISHHSDIDISKFHSTLFRVIGFFRYAPKISLIRPKFFSLFFRVADFLNSLRRDFHFFPTTFGFWDFWGSVGTFVFFGVVSDSREGFVLTPTTGRYAQSTQTLAVSVTQPLQNFFLWHLEAGGARRPPGPPFDEIAWICWYLHGVYLVLPFRICNWILIFLKNEKVNRKKDKKIKKSLTIILFLNFGPVFIFYWNSLAKLIWKCKFFEYRKFIAVNYLICVPNFVTRSTDGLEKILTIHKHRLFLADWRRYKRFIWSAIKWPI